MAVSPTLPHSAASHPCRAARHDRNRHHPSSTARLPACAVALKTTIAAIVSFQVGREERGPPSSLPAGGPRGSETRLKVEVTHCSLERRDLGPTSGWRRKGESFPLMRRLRARPVCEMGLATVMSGKPARMMLGDKAARAAALDLSIPASSSVEHAGVLPCLCTAAGEGYFGCPVVDPASAEARKDAVSQPAVLGASEQTSPVARCQFAVLNFEIPAWANPERADAKRKKARRANARRAQCDLRNVEGWLRGQDLNL